MANDDEKKGRAEQRQLEPDADGNVRIDVFAGPYRGNLLTVPAAEGQQAINDHWARDPFSGVPYGEGHDPLTDEERAAALEAATTWAKAQWEAGTQEPPPEGGEGTTPAEQRRRRSMAAENPGGYATRDATPPQEPTPVPPPRRPR